MKKLINKINDWGLKDRIPQKLPFEDGRLDKIIDKYKLVYVLFGLAAFYFIFGIGYQIYQMIQQGFFNYWHDFFLPLK